MTGWDVTIGVVAGNLGQMDKLVLNCFGVGDGWPCADRGHSSYLYNLAGSSVLIDCGEPLSRTLKATGLSPDTIDQIFLSHLHFDHIGGFFMLMQGLWLQQRRKELLVHMPKDGLAPIRQLLDVACLFDALLPFPFRMKGLKDGQTVSVGNIRVIALANTHLDGFRKSFQLDHPQQYEAFSFLIEANGWRVGHSADIGAVEDLTPLVEHPLDLLVCELAHATPEDLFRFLRDKPIKRLILTHLNDRLWKEQGTVSELARRMMPGIDFSIARDGEEIVVDHANQGA
jgi:ribonuclease BN (tRNA processing enzyme)